MTVEDVLPRDAIPSIDEPDFGTAYFGDPDDEVIVVAGEPARAYPIRILSYHEIVNDVVDGEPIAVTWCPICWSAVVYERTVDGRTLTFGVSGKLADDALVMYDRETDSQWKQPTGEAFEGELAGTRLAALPAATMSWERFRSEHLDGVVLQPVRGRGSDGTGGSPAQAYDMAPYERYVEGEEFGLYGMRGVGEPRAWDREDLDPKTAVLGIEHGEAAVGFPIPRVEAAGGVVRDTVDGLDVVVFATTEGSQAFANPGYAFEPVADGSDRFRADGTVWDGVTGASDDGRRLARVPTRRLFAFAWQAAHGLESFYDASE